MRMQSQRQRQWHFLSLNRVHYGVSNHVSLPIEQATMIFLFLGSAAKASSAKFGFLSGEGHQEQCKNQHQEICHKTFSKANGFSKLCSLH